MLVCELLNTSTNCSRMSDKNPNPDGKTCWITPCVVGVWLQGNIKK